MKVTDIYGYFSSHRKVRAGSLIAVTAVLVCLLCTLHFSEDISDFLPLGTKEREEMSIYQGISGAERLYVLFSNPGDADRTAEAVDLFTETVSENDPEDWFTGMTGGMDMEAIAEVSAFVYGNAPYFLTEGDYARMDSLLSEPGYLGQALARDREMLMFPSSSLVAGGIRHDPLALFSPVMSRLQASGGQMGFELYDGHVFTPDMSRAVVMSDSPFGSSETDNNTKLIKILEEASAKLHEAYPDVPVDIIGGPAIAVGNSSRIKKDSILAISLSAVLIILLLVYSFNSVRNILLIFLSVGWGLVFALGGLAVFRDRVSIIVIGISSVILGIAFNYPLHLITHTAQQRDRKAALKEIVSPLVIGNVTTVGAFLALVPLKSTALRDLGLFASLLLAGTILFVLLYLPHYVSDHRDIKHESRFLDRLAAFSPDRNRYIVVGAAVATVLFAFFSFRTGFDTDMSHINYMTEAQRRDMQYFEALLSRNDTRSAQSLYVYGKGASFDEALQDLSQKSGALDSLALCSKLARQNEFLSFMVPAEEQLRRIDRWNAFVGEHREQLTDGLEKAAAGAGFAPNAFASFASLIDRPLEPIDCEAFTPLLNTVFARNVTRSEDGKSVYAVSAVNVEPSDMEEVKSAVGDKCFDVAGMNSALTRTLSDNFNYIGWACSLIVFFFLWFSFGRIELAIISFLPMAVSWVWILGLMALLGIKFNIVNVILATFIFGQGDDYTIFVTEGCQYEYARRSPILKSYKRSILQSAAIMFVGIGTLIVARHPAMRSLAEVTVIGMFSVVLMACLIPPLLFRFLTCRGGRERTFPLTLKTLFLGAPRDPVAVVMNRYAYRGKEIERTVRRNLKDKCMEMINLNVSVKEVIEMEDKGYGELSLLVALSHPETRVVSHIPDPERRATAVYAAGEVVGNVEFIS